MMEEQICASKGQGKEDERKGEKVRSVVLGCFLKQMGIPTASPGVSLISPLACALNFVQISFRCGHEI